MRWVTDAQFAHIIILKSMLPYAFFMELRNSSFLSHLSPTPLLFVFLKQCGFDLIVLTRGNGLYGAKKSR